MTQQSHLYSTKFINVQFTISGAFDFQSYSSGNTIYKNYGDDIFIFNFIKLFFNVLVNEEGKNQAKNHFVVILYYFALAFVDKNANYKKVYLDRSFFNSEQRIYIMYIGE